MKKEKIKFNKYLTYIYLKTKLYYLFAFLKVQKSWSNWENLFELQKGINVDSLFTL